jgi:hypothetical protein
MPFFRKMPFFRADLRFKIRIIAHISQFIIDDCVFFCEFGVKSARNRRFRPFLRRKTVLFSSKRRLDVRKLRFCAVFARFFVTFFRSFSFLFEWKKKKNRKKEKKKKKNRSSHFFFFFFFFWWSNGFFSSLFDGFSSFFFGFYLFVSKGCFFIMESCFFSRFFRCFYFSKYWTEEKKKRKMQEKNVFFRQTLTLISHF